MDFSITDDGVLYLYPYYSMNEKEDEMSRRVYHVFKRGWDTYLGNICEDLHSAICNYSVRCRMQELNIAITVMPSHSKGAYGANLLKVAGYLSSRLRYENDSYLIQRTVEKKKSTEGGERTVLAHLETLGLAHGIGKNMYYIILDDITTTGSSLESAKQLLNKSGVPSSNIIKMAVAKTMHDE